MAGSAGVKVSRSKKITLGRKVLEKNDAIAEALREKLKGRGIVTLNFISSPGSGKTLLLEKTLKLLKGRVGCAVIVGDQETDNDAKRLSGKGAAVQQIKTGNSCHLIAENVKWAVDKVLKPKTKLLFIENIGNLICPAVFDLGEDLKIVLLSVTEGEDKPVKYPTVFSLADVVVLSKMDLAPHVSWKRRLCLANLKKVAPKAKVFELSARGGEGLGIWCEFLEELIKNT